MDLFTFTQGRRTRTVDPSATDACLFYSPPRLECLSRLLAACCSLTDFWQSVMKFTCILATPASSMEVLYRDLITVVPEILDKWYRKCYCHRLTQYFGPSQWCIQSLACSSPQCERSTDTDQTLAEKMKSYILEFSAPSPRLLLDAQGSNDDKWYL